MTGYRVPPKVLNPAPGTAAWQRQVEQNLAVLGQQATAQQGYRPPRRANGLASPTILYDSLGAPIGRLVTDSSKFSLAISPNLTELQYPLINTADPEDPVNYSAIVLTVDFTSSDDEDGFTKPITTVGVPTILGRPLGNIIFYGLPIFANIGVGTGTDIQLDSTGMLRKVSSSEKYKQDISRDMSLQMCIDLVEGLRPASYRYKDEVARLGDEAPTHFNFIAEDVDALGPDAKPLIYYADGEPDALSENGYKVIITKVVQHLLSENQALKLRIEALELAHASD